MVSTKTNSKSTGVVYTRKLYFDPNADSFKEIDYWITDDELREELVKMIDVKDTILEVRYVPCYGCHLWVTVTALTILMARAEELPNIAAYVIVIGGVALFDIFSRAFYQLASSAASYSERPFYFELSTMDKQAKPKLTIADKVLLVENCLASPEFRRMLTESINDAYNAIPVTQPTPNEQEDGVSQLLFCFYLHVSC